MSVTARYFGKTMQGEDVTIYHISNSAGMTAEVMDYGAVLVSLYVPDRNGKFEDVVLGYDTIDGYRVNRFFFGGTMGRNSNRVAGAHFELNGVGYDLEKNEKENNLHSCLKAGFHKRMVRAEKGSDNISVKFIYDSPHLDEGFPGNLTASVTYRITEDNVLELVYEGVSDADTIFNMTNHSYFNLAGRTDESILDHRLYIKASGFTPINSEGIPTGEIAPVAGTPFDFTEPHEIGERIEADDPYIKMVGGYDHNYALDIDCSKCEEVAVLSHEKSGRRMTVYTDRPGLQFYAGNYIISHMGKERRLYHPHCGVCLETQFFPNAINEPRFMSPVLKAGVHATSVTKYAFDVF